MDEKTLVKISFITTIIGLGFLFIYSEQFNLEFIDSIDSIPVTEEVKLKGLVKSVTTTDNAVFLKLEGEKIIKTDIIFFPGEEIPLKEGDHIELYGEVEEYNDEKEVIASKIVRK